MESAVGIIWRNIIQIEDNTDKHIAKLIYKDYQENIFRDINELAKNSNVVPATITNFCKKNGFTGYRQLRERLKFEYEKYINKDLNLETSTEFSGYIDFYKEIFNKFLGDLTIDEQFINNLKKVVYFQKTLTVFVGAQLNSSIDFLVKLLNEENIFCKKILIGETLFDDVHKFINDKESPYLFIFTGEDNEILYYIYENIFDNSYKNLFFITTTGQRNRINSNEENILVLRSKVKWFNSFYRKIFIQLLFLIMFDKANKR